MIENLSKFYNFILANCGDLPRKAGEAFSRFLGYRAAYIVYCRSQDGSYAPAAYFGDKVYAKWYEVFAAKYFQDDIFVQHMNKMIYISGFEKKYVWRIQDFQPIEEFRKSAYYTNGLAVHGVGYRAWINFPQSWDRQQHTIAVFKSTAAGDFDEGEVHLLNQVGLFLEAAMKSYQESVESSLLRELVLKYGVAANESACVLNCLYRVIFQTESFDAARREALGGCAIWEAAQRLLDGREPSALPPGKSYSSVICGARASYRLEVTPFWSPVDFVHKTQYLLLIKLFREDENGLKPQEKAEPRAAALESCYMRLMEQYGLTKREYDVLKLIASGTSTNDIARALFVSISTVRTHVGNLFMKLNVHNRTELVAKLMSIRQEYDS